jgi:hypothetical protein
MHYLDVNSLKIKSYFTCVSCYTILVKNVKNERSNRIVKLFER